MDEITFSKIKKRDGGKGMGLSADSKQSSVYDFIVKEYSDFTADELNKQAWVSSGEGISGINCKGLGNMGHQV